MAASDGGLIKSIGKCRKLWDSRRLAERKTIRNKDYNDVKSAKNQNQFVWNSIILHLHSRIGLRQIWDPGLMVFTPSPKMKFQVTTSVLIPQKTAFFERNTFCTILGKRRQPYFGVKIRPGLAPHQPHNKGSRGMMPCGPLVQAKCGKSAMFLS